MLWPHELVVFGQSLRSAGSTSFNLQQRQKFNQPQTSSPTISPVNNSVCVRVCVCSPVQCTVPPPGRQWRCPLSPPSDDSPSPPNRSPEPACNWETRKQNRHNFLNITFSYILWQIKIKHPVFLQSPDHNLNIWYNWEYCTNNCKYHQKKSKFIDGVVIFLPNMDVIYFELRLKTWT